MIAKPISIKGAGCKFGGCAQPDTQAQNFANAGSNEELKKEIDTEMDRLIAQRDTRTERGRIILNGLRFRAKQDQLESLFEAIPQQ